MEDLSGKLPAFKKIDYAIFDRLDKYKQTPNYVNLQDFYNGLEEDQQKALKGGLILSLFLLPLLLLSFLWWKNSNLKEELEMRTQIVNRANEIIGQRQSLQAVKFNVISGSPIDSDSMMTSRLSGLLSGIGVDLGKIQVKEFNTNPASTEILKSEADFTFVNMSTDELMNTLTAMIQREKFRISDITITRNPQSNFLQGKFHAIHFSAISAAGEEE
ncbi:MAG TPA: hypothetical protein VNJ08_16265 [Bacteriovoracaceae bacterium]|nr:hypothetical protein [Bacteriovoracaceae bacterium]